MVGNDCLKLFRKKYGKELALSNLKEQAQLDNKANIVVAFHDYKEALEQNQGITTFKIGNVDEKSISTVQVPPKILAKKRSETGWQ